MATVARSPSPGPARPCCGGGGLRRSADSSPFRPAASPPDSPRRSCSGCKAGGRAASSRACGAEKENDHNHQPDAVRAGKPARLSSGGGGGGGTKSFMAPTISAASKASPRKRVLGERNNDLPQHHHPHPVPSSPGDLAHTKPRAAPPPEADLGAPRRLRLSLDGAPAPPPAAAVAPSHGARLSFGGEAEEEDRVEDPVCNNHPDHHHHDVAAADAPAAPYDPKTNFLSPRPRFLHYKPNPRIEQYRQGGASVRRLEDGFASESSDELSAATTEEDDLTEEEQEQPQMSDFQEEDSPPAASPGVRVLAPEHGASSPPARAPTPEPKATSPRAGALAPEPEPAATRAKKKKKRSALRFLFAPLALVLFMAAALICVPPPPGSPVMLNTSLAKVSDFISVQELHPVELAAWLKNWSSSSLDLVTSYLEALASAQEQEFIGPHFAANLSAAAADADPGVDFYYSAVETSPMPSKQEAITASVLEPELAITLEVVSASDPEVIADSEVEEIASLSEAAVTEEHISDAEIDQETESAGPSAVEEANESNDGLIVVEELNAEMAEVTGSSEEEMASSRQNLASQSTPEPEHVEDMESSLQQDVQTDESGGDHADGMEDQEAYHGLKMGSNMWSGYLDKVSNPAAVGAALSAIIVPAALAFLYMRRKQDERRVNPDKQDDLAGQAEQDDLARQAEQVETQSGSGSSEHVFVKDSEFLNPMVQDTDRTGDYGASQYSSSLSSGYGRRRKAKAEESLSLEPMSRRDSTAQSTSSYGSFTTYEKIPAKKKNKEDEVMTPVRRSSRLRNVKSPEA
ncbi:hypothetical protein ACP70R_024728 [Stipagrostis hirtigluma subsp. patula]